jgi:cis-3-alkyl-4-acyloxetan-2-one decarboxylase
VNTKTAPPDVPSELLPGYPGPDLWRRVPATGQHYVDIGTGEPILLLHGNPSWSYVWRRLLARLTLDFRCVAPDLPGMGLSPRPPMPPDPADWPVVSLDHLDALSGHLTASEPELPARGWTLILHDWGGPLGIAWALRNPGVVARLIVVNTIGFRWPPGYRLPFYLKWIRDHRAVASFAHATNVFPRLALRAGVAHPLDAADRRAYLLPYAHRADRRGIVEFVRAIPRAADDRTWRLLEHADELLAGLPVFVGWGMRDPVFTPLVLTEWIRRFPRAQVRRYASAGHFVMEDAADELGGHIREFLLGRTVR